MHRTQYVFGLMLGLAVGCSAFGVFAQGGTPYEAPRLMESNACSIIVVPDFQTYSKSGRNQGICELMTAWIAKNLQTLSVLTVMQTGDLVEQNGINKPAGENVDQTSAQQWSAVSRAFGRLDGKTPYILATGNHDYGIVSSENRDTHFAETFYWSFKS